MDTHENFDEWFTGAYPELHAISRRSSAYERAGHTLTPTAVLHEAYITLRGTLKPGKSNDAFLFACFRKTIRRKLIDYARFKTCQKRNNKRCLHLQEPGLVPERSDSQRHQDILLIIEQLQRSHPRAAAVADMRLNTHLSLPLIAERLGVSLRTVSYDWNVAVDFARDWVERNS